MDANKQAAQKQKDIFADNLTFYLSLRGKFQADMVNDLDVTSSTVSDWANAKKYPRVDKMQAIADYLDIPISALREQRDKPEELTDDKQQLIDIIKGLSDHQAKLARNYLDLLIQKQNE